MRAFKMKLAMTLLLTSSAAAAAETIRYVYDTRGRLITVVRQSLSATTTTRYVLDRADNRTGKQITAP